MSPEVRDLLALHLVPGLGPRLTAALLERFGSAAAARKASPAQLLEVPHIGPQLANQLAQSLPGVDVDAELQLIGRYNVRLLVLNGPGYPPALAALANPPHLLYVRGSLTAADQRAVAIVGSRHCSSYGKRVAERLSADLARAGFTIISGLARGIDSMAHRG